MTTHRTNHLIRTVTRMTTLCALLLGATALSPPPARACGMEAFYERPRSRPLAPALVAKARQSMKRGRLPVALSLATTVIGDERANPHDRAQAYAVVGWVRWSRGDRASAIEALRLGRAIDASATDVVLDETTDTKARASLRKALAA